MARIRVMRRKGTVAPTGPRGYVRACVISVFGHCGIYPIDDHSSKFFHFNKWQREELLQELSLIEDEETTHQMALPYLHKSLRVCLSNSKKKKTQPRELANKHAIHQVRISSGDVPSRIELCLIL
jgi:hypothetical protein